MGQKSPIEREEGPVFLEHGKQEWSGLACM